MLEKRGDLRVDEGIVAKGSMLSSMDIPSLEKLLEKLRCLRLWCATVRLDLTDTFLTILETAEYGESSGVWEECKYHTHTLELLYVRCAHILYIYDINIMKNLYNCKKKILIALWSRIFCKITWGFLPWRWGDSSDLYDAVSSRVSQYLFSYSKSW